MNDVYFACRDCKEYIDAGYRIAYWELERTGLVSKAEPVNAQAVLDCTPYWNSLQPGDSRKQLFIRIRMFLQVHQPHEICYGDSDRLGKYDQPGNDFIVNWLDQSPGSEPYSLRDLFAKHGVRDWQGVQDYLAAHPDSALAESGITEADWMRLENPDVRELNRHAWDMLAEGGNEWTVPVSPEVIARARAGDWSVLLTESTPTPRDWFPAEMKGVEILGLAASGGQQGPVLAAAGATVTVLDNSPRQLERDRRVAEREGLAIRTVEGDMADLSVFPAASFDLIFHPVSNCFIPDPRPVWRECFRVLRPGGALLAGFLNPVLFMFDSEAEERGELKVKYRLPYADTTHLPQKELHARLDGHQPIEFSHSLDSQIGGQLAAGFALTGLFEDRRRGGLLAEYTPLYIATRAVKPRQFK